MDATKVAIKQEAHCVTRRCRNICGGALVDSEEGGNLKFRLRGAQGVPLDGFTTRFEMDAK